jgi:hypothetical protein
MVDRSTGIVAGSALSIAAGAIGVGALRWGSLDLADLRGVQSVLGPTLLVGPDRSALASAMAAGAAVIALAVWMSSFAEGLELRSRKAALWLAEGVIGAFAVVTVFFDPAESALAGGDFVRTLLTLGRWAASVIGATTIVVGIALVLRRGGHRWRLGALSLAALSAIAAAVVVVSII